jgi:CheY-like chemotaxis protein
MAKILMIDDDRDLVASMKILLEARGHEFHHTANGEAGLRAVGEIAPDLIVLDVMMDRYTEGFRVSQLLRDPADDSEYAAYRAVPIVVLTSIHRTTTHRFGANEDALPVDAFLEKPVPHDQLLTTIAELLAKGAARRSPGVASHRAKCDDARGDPRLAADATLAIISC